MTSYYKKSRFALEVAGGPLETAYWLYVCTVFYKCRWLMSWLSRVYGFGGLERWNGMVEWTGLDWNGMERKGL